MPDLTFVLYTAKDDEDALALEGLCVQGKSLSLKFRRPSFRARSELYENYKIFCAKEGKRLIGIIAGAVKRVELHGQAVKALYVYDLRVHPDYRRRGVAKKLCTILIDDMGKNTDCIYTLIHGQNDRAFSLACRYFTPEVILPLTYAVLPVYKRYHVENYCLSLSVSEAHELYRSFNADREFLPSFNQERLRGYVASISLKKGKAGCSIWTNENILAEQVVRIPFRFQLMRPLSRPLRLFLKIPPIPRPDEVIRSWFLFDLYAEDKLCLQKILAAANNLALSKGRSFLYILLQNCNPLLSWIKHSRLKVHTFPYALLARGNIFPSQADTIYIDVRDL